MARVIDGSLVISRVSPGRGAWLCRDPGTSGPAAGCLLIAARRNAFAKAFREDVPASALALLRDEWLQRENMEPLEK